MSLNPPHIQHTLTLTLMSIDIIKGLLSKANTGDQILEVLNTFVSDSEEQQTPDTYGTLEDLMF